MFERVLPRKRSRLRSACYEHRMDSEPTDLALPVAFCHSDLSPHDRFGPVMHLHSAVKLLSFLRFTAAKGTLVSLATAVQPEEDNTVELYSFTSERAR